MLAQGPRESTSFGVMNNTTKQASSRADKLFAGAKNIFRSIFVAKLDRNEYKRGEAAILYKMQMCNCGSKVVLKELCERSKFYFALS